MDDKITNLKTKTKTKTNAKAKTLTSNLGYLAEVIDVEQGQATVIFIPDLNKEVRVSSHGSRVPALRAGDAIIVMCIDSDYIVFDRLRQEGERAQQGYDLMPDGSLQIKNAKGIVMELNGSKIELRKDGGIIVDGKEVYAFANGTLLLQGAIIKAN